MSALAEPIALDGAQVQRAVEEATSATSAVVAVAQRLEVRDDITAQQATELVAQIAAESKRREAARIELVKPLNDHVKGINARFKEATEPLDEARRIVSEKLLAYQAEQERLRAEAQARLDAERRAAEEAAAEQRRQEEAAAQAAREQAAREAAAAEAAARKAEQEETDRRARETDERKQQIATLANEELREIIVEYGRRGGVEADAALARAELDSRAAARKAQEEADAARQREQEARAAEQAVRDTPAPAVPAAQVAPVAKLAAPSGGVATRKVWKHEIEDASRVPREYLAIDETKIRQAIRDGVRSIPGVRIEQVPELAVRTAA